MASETISTRRGTYRPAAPEAPTWAARVFLRVQIALGLGIVLALGACWYALQRDQQRPVKLSSFRDAAFFKPAPASFAAAAEQIGGDGADAGKGKVLYAQTCMTCHGQNLQGMPHQGTSLRDSKFVAATNDPKLVAFLKIGRRPADAGNRTGLLMPPRGGNPALDDDGLSDIVAYMRQIQREHAADPNASAGVSWEPICECQ